MDNTAKTLNFNEEALLKEYYEIVKIVGEFDGRLMTVKGWGVTLSLAALAGGFQFGHYGLFLVASFSGLGFWIIEAQMKRHQKRHYVRMREIEVLQYERALKNNMKEFSTPRIDSSWVYAGRLFTGHAEDDYHPKVVKRSKGPYLPYRLALFFPHVFLPHLATFLLGIVLLIMAKLQYFGPEMKW